MTRRIAGSTLYPAEQYSYCPAQLMGLSNDWTALSDKIDAMQPNGNTNQAIGLQVGWQSLSVSPFTVPDKDPNYRYKDVIILLTDGLNTQDRWYRSQSSIDAREEKTLREHQKRWPHHLYGASQYWGRSDFDAASGLRETTPVSSFC